MHHHQSVVFLSVNSHAASPRRPDTHSMLRKVQRYDVFTRGTVFHSALHDTLSCRNGGFPALFPATFQL